ncbi:MAG TPA: hypothetical protein PK323_08310 [Bacteroidia bacterium]|nr:hypothetical protein [Bacteroidia bacterium]
MKTIQIQKIKISIILFYAFFTTSEAQIKPINTDNRLITSIDYTTKGPQGSIAYDFYTKNGTCVGFSFSQLQGLKQFADNTWYYNLDYVRFNFSGRLTYTYIETKLLRTFIIAKAGCSYNTILEKNDLNILPSFSLGGGADIFIVNSSGIRLEGGIGSPYFASIGYFFKL